MRIEDEVGFTRHRYCRLRIEIVLFLYIGCYLDRQFMAMATVVGISDCLARRMKSGEEKEPEGVVRSKWKLAFVGNCRLSLTEKHESYIKEQSTPLSHQCT